MKCKVMNQSSITLNFLCNMLNQSCIIILILKKIKMQRQVSEENKDLLSVNKNNDDFNSHYLKLIILKIKILTQLNVTNEKS